MSDSLPGLHAWAKMVVQDQPKKLTGRPSSYTEAVGRRICEEMSEGRLLIDILSEPGMPPQRTVNRWCDQHSEFKSAYELARAMQGHHAAEAAVRFALNTTNETERSDRLKFDALRWFAAKLLPKHYGDRVETTVSGEVTFAALITQSFNSIKEERKVIEGSVEEPE